MGILGGAAGSGHRLQCPAKLVQKLAKACGPPCRTGSIRKVERLAAIAPGAKSAGAASWFTRPGALVYCKGSPHQDDSEDCRAPPPFTLILTIAPVLG